MTTYTRTCRCGAVFEAQDHRVKWCLACRTAKAEAEAAIEAARPMKVCARCGKQEQIKRRHAWCLACREEDNAARLEQMRAERREQRRREYWESIDERRAQSSEELTYEERKASYLAQFAELPLEEQQRHILFLIKHLSDALPATKLVEEVDPEQVPHTDQDRIDREFRQLMEGLDL